MQREVINKGSLLNEKGELNEVGYARSLIKDYKREAIKAKKIRIKEWDYYLVHNEEYALCLTLDDNSYMNMVSVSIIDFKNKVERTVSPIKFFTWGKTGLVPSSKEGDEIYEDKKSYVSFSHIPHGRILKVKMKNWYNKQDFECEVKLLDEPEDSMVIITPFKENKKAFYYNQKIVGFKAEGYFQVGEYKYEFSQKDTRGILDWGRGVWTYKNTWYWGAGTGVVDGHEVGFNIGYGFGDTSAASENVIFYDGKLHKIDQVTFNISQDDKGKYLYLEPWTFSSNDGRFEMNFTPIINRASCTDILIIKSDQNQVFGRFNGTMILDDGTKIELKDFLGFAERVYNKW